MKKIERVLLITIASLLVASCSLLETASVEPINEPAFKKKLPELSHVQPDISAFSASELKKFKSDKTFQDYLNIASELKSYRRSRYLASEEYNDDDQKIVVTGSRIKASDTKSITNNQVSGVDEGDIVKLSKNYLIVLRQGELFSIRIGSDSARRLKPTSKIKVTPPGWKHDSWYDEMLIVDNMIIVLGYSYELEASEILRFKIDHRGKLKYLDGYLVSSDDYFSGGNYASRIFNRRFVSYIPVDLSGSSKRAEELIPKIAKIRGSGKSNLNWKPLFESHDIYEPLQYVSKPTLHSVIECDPLAKKFSCNAVAVIGSRWSEYYVSRGSFYLWSKSTSSKMLYDYRHDNGYYRFFHQDNLLLETDDSLLYKISFENFDVTAVKLYGEPLDQFSFHEYENELFVILESQTDPEHSQNLFKIPLSRFDRFASFSAQSIFELPKENEQLNNRFYKNYLSLGAFKDFLYKNGRSQPKFDYNFSVIELGTLNINKTNLGHTSDRIEVHNDHYFISGVNSKGNLSASVFSLAEQQIYAKAEWDSILESEASSHAFNARSFDDLSVFGITTVDKSDASSRENIFDYYWNDNQASDVYFIGMDTSGNLFEVGKFQNSLNSNIPENCETSCYDWYGNTRPFFIGERIFGLSGNQVFEGELYNGKVKLVNSADMTKVSAFRFR